MKLISFKVKNYRSILETQQIPIHDLTIFLGPNNEGKSNLLKALVVALDLITEKRNFIFSNGRLSISRSSIYDPGLEYDWKRDFPLQLQNKYKLGRSVFTLVFSLSKEETVEFQTEVGCYLNGNLPIEISISPEDIQYRVIKRGKGKTTLSSKQLKIANFISKRLAFTYIPTDRKAGMTQRIIDRLIRTSLRNLESDEEYKEALEKVKGFEEPIVNSISDSIKANISLFIPEVNSIDISPLKSNRYLYMTDQYLLNIDDGVRTALEFKGDGMQSLISIALTKHIHDNIPNIDSFIITIEEPEIHLHPFASHELKNVIDEMSSKFQIIITTHNPIFINRKIIASNIIVKDNKANSASSIKDIRDTLGVQTSDNLKHADLILLVEGDDDNIALSAIIKKLSEKLDRAIKEGKFIIDSLRGASNVAYYISLYDSQLCKIHVFLDHDSAGRKAIEKSIEDSLISVSDYNLSVCNGMGDSELEDLYNYEVYFDFIKDKYSVDLNNSQFRNSESKWSDRVKQVFQAHGKIFNSDLESKIKLEIAKIVEKDPIKALNGSRINCISALIYSMEQKLERLSQ
jgi:putative ATP-dependent endonuclease of the OLD family